MITNPFPSASDSGNLRPTMFEYIGPIRERLDDQSGRFHLPTISGFAGEVAAILDQQREEEAKQPIKRTANVFAKNHNLENRTTKRTIEKAQKILQGEVSENNSVIDTIDYLQEKNATTAMFILAMLRTAESQESKNSHPRNIAKLISGEDEVNGLALPGALMQIDESQIGSNHAWLYDNKSLNYLRLIGAVPQVDYDELHRRGMYLFTEGTTSTQFAHKVSGYRNGAKNEVQLIRDKDVLEIGPGNGADVDHFVKEGANSVTVLDGSEFILTRLRDRYKKNGQLHSNENPAGRVVVPNNWSDMHDTLSAYALHGQTFDTITAHSCFHYFDDEEVKNLVEYMHAVLKDQGHLAFAVKAPGAVLDGNGIKLFSNEEAFMRIEADKKVSEEIQFIRSRMWMNLDGQTRAFRSDQAWTDLLESHFDVVERSSSIVRNYEAPGSDQQFYNFICRKKNLDRPLEV